MPPLRSGDELADHAQSVLQCERRGLAALTGAQLVLTGGSSIAGSLTVGDVDLHLRVDPADFAAVVERLRDIYEVVHPEIWTGTLATFAVLGEDVGVAVTPIGSEHDRRFTDAWRRLGREPQLLEAYNGMKREHADAGPSAYLEAKRTFFDSLAADSAAFDGTASTGRP